MASLPPEFFRRQDERPDALFYAVPRPVRHLDDGASAVVDAWYDEMLPAEGAILDLLAGAYSYLPDRFDRVIGLGLDPDALQRNPRLTDRWRLDLSERPRLRLADRGLAGAVCTASVQYLTQPTEAFAEVARCLRPGAPFLVVFSNRMLPSRAVLCWRASDDAARGRLVRTYFAEAGGFGQVEARSFVPAGGGDPVYLVGASVDPAAAG